MVFPVLHRMKSAAALSALALLAGAPTALAETPTAAQHSPGVERILEQDVTNLPGTREGQPVVAINPGNPDNLVYVATIFPDRPGLEPVGECFVAFSQNRGRTWRRSTWPLGDRPQCGEPIVTTDAKGVFYLSNNQIGPDAATTYTNHNVVSRSVDGGLTWIGPVRTPLMLGGAPKLRVDSATGKVYAVMRRRVGVPQRGLRQRGQRRDLVGSCRDPWSHAVHHGLPRHAPGLRISGP